MASVSKICSDFLRESYPGLKASHARELVAAFYGYRTHSALLAEQNFDADRTARAKILIPDVPLIDKRLHCLDGLAEGVDLAQGIAEDIVQCLEENELFRGEVWWNCENIADYMLHTYLPSTVSLSDELCDQIAETNAYFDDENYETAQLTERSNELEIVAAGSYGGEHDWESDRFFCGDTIDFTVTVNMKRVAGRVGFGEPECTVTGEVRDWSEAD